MRVAVFTDEINRENPLRALQMAQDWGIEAVEVRGMSGGRFPRVDDKALATFGERIADAGLAVSGVSPGLFKEAVDHPAVEEGMGTLLPRACEWARRWGTDLVSCFGFARGPGPLPAQVIDGLVRMTQIATAGGCRLVFENEAVCWGDTGTAAARLVRQVPGLRLCWDPGNAARAGAAEPYPGEYAALRDLVAHVHVKNYLPAQGRWSVIDEGSVDWPGQLRALADDGYRGDLVLETHTPVLPAGAEPSPHLTPLEANTRHNLFLLRALLTRP